MRVLVTRPEEDAGDLAEILQARGIDVLLEPLITITYRDADEPDLTDIQAILITSANGVRALASASGVRDLPIYAVGDASARAAESSGFLRVESASGDVDALVKLVTEKLDPADGPLFHAAGSALAGDLAGKLEQAGFEVHRGVLYDSETARALSPAAIAAIKDDKLDGVLLFSPRTAAAFADLARKARLIRSARNITAYCLSDAVAEEAADLPWRAVKVAPHPTQDALLDLLDGAAATADADPPKQNQREEEEDQEPTAARGASPLPSTPPPGVTYVPAAKRRGGLTAFFVSVVVLAVFIGGLAATMPYWVPEFARYLPGQPPPPDPRVAQLAGRIDEFEQRARTQQQETAQRRIEASQAVADLEVERARLSDELKQAMDRVATLESALSEVRREVETATASPGNDEAAEHALKELSDRLAKIESAGMESAIQDREKIETLSRKITELEARADARNLAAENIEIRALELAIDQLRGALHGSGPFADQLAALIDVAGGNRDVTALAEDLKPYASSGVATLAELRERFEAVAAAISVPVVADGDAVEPGWIDRLMARLGKFVKVRRVDAQGTGNDAVLSRAEIQLDSGNLEGAVTALAGLDTAAQAKAADWLNAARARVGAERALARLQVLAISRKRAADG